LVLVFRINSSWLSISLQVILALLLTFSGFAFGWVSEHKAVNDY
jgi:hypothetical protein